MNNSKHKIRDFLSKRNVSIFILFGIIIGASIGLTIYNLQLLEQYSNNGNGSTEISIKITGNVNREVIINLTQLKSEYKQVINQAFYSINSVGSTFKNNYTGAQVWDILSKSKCLNPNSTRIRFISNDGYTHEKTIQISLTQQYPHLMILAYEKNGIPFGEISDEGPIKVMVNRSLFPEWSTQYDVKDVGFIVVY